MVKIGELYRKGIIIFLNLMTILLIGEITIFVLLRIDIA